MNLAQRLLGIGALTLSLTAGCTTPPSHDCGKLHESRGKNHNCNDSPHLFCLQRRFDLGEKVDYFAHRKEEEIKNEFGRNAHKYKEEKLYCILGGLAEQIGPVDVAVQNYLKAKKFESAARLLELDDQHEKAHKNYEQAFEHYHGTEKCFTCSLRVAEKLNDKEKIRKAMRSLLEVKEKERDFMSAAYLAEQLGEFGRAVRNAELGGLLPYAAALAEQIGDKARALRNYELMDPKDKKVITLSEELGRAAENRSDYLAALGYYKKAVKAGSDFNRHDVVRVARNIGFYEDALEYSSGDEREGLVQEIRRSIMITGEHGYFERAEELAKLIGDEKQAAAFRKAAQQLEDHIKSLK